MDVRKGLVQLLDFVICYLVSCWWDVFFPKDPICWMLLLKHIRNIAIIVFKGNMLLICSFWKRFPILIGFRKIIVDLLSVRIPVELRVFPRLDQRLIVKLSWLHLTDRVVQVISLSCCPILSSPIGVFIPRVQIRFILVLNVDSWHLLFNCLWWLFFYEHFHILLPFLLWVRLSNFIY